MGKKRRILTTKKFNAKHSAHPRMKMAAAPTTPVDTADPPPVENKAMAEVVVAPAPEPTLPAPILTAEVEVPETKPVAPKTTKTKKTAPRKKSATSRRKRTTKKKTTSATA